MPKKRVFAPKAPPAPVPSPGPAGSAKKPSLRCWPETLTRWAWRNRWQLSPVLALLLVFWAGEGGGFSAAVTGVAGGGLLLSRRSGAIGARMYLSERERWAAGLWLTIASAWQLFVLLPLPIPGLVELVALSAATGYPTWVWCASRKPARARKVSTAGRKRLADWALKVAVAPGSLKGSSVAWSTIGEPSPGTLVFEVVLRDDVHNADAASDTSRKAVERLLNLPADCAKVEPVRGDSARIRVVIAPERILETATAPFTGFTISPEGLMIIARDDAGQTVSIQKWGKDGIKHGRGCGTSGTGKTGTLRRIVPPGIEAEIELAWLIDGKRGTSAPELREVFDWYSIEDAEWLTVFLVLEAIVIDRQKRRGLLGLSQWRTGYEADPNIVLYIEECDEVAKRVGKIGARACLTILKQGRAVGVSMYQTGQDPLAEFIIGGRPGRDALSMGFEILGKPGGKQSRNMSQDSNDSTTKVNLLTLPAGEGLEGFAAVLQGGKVISSKCRVEYVSDEDLAEWVADVRPRLRTLSGADLAAAGARYLRRGVVTDDPLVYTDELADELGDDPAQTAAELSEVQAWLLKVLTINRDGLTLSELVTKGGGVKGRSRRNISINLATLKSDGKVEQTGETWGLVSS